MNLKTLFIATLIAIFAALRAHSQTNIYTTQLKTNAIATATCGGKNYKYVATALWRNPVNQWFTLGASNDPGYGTLTFTNQDVLFQWVVRTGGGGCGHGTLTIDPALRVPGNQFSFNMWVSNSVPWWNDTNSLRGIVAVGFTNAP